MDGISRGLCSAVHRLRYEDLPAPVVAGAKNLILDVLGVIGGAAAAPGIPELHRRLVRWEPEGSATALLTRVRHSPPTAALANGAAAHALDFDDLHDGARVHTSCVVLPALLAAAEDVAPISGREFLLGMVVGAEVHARLGLACPDSLAIGWHPTMVHGALAASLAAGRLLALDVDGLVDALGLAFHQTSGSAQCMHDGVLAKRLGAGFAARAAVLGAFLAKDGLTGIRRTLEGDAGLFELYARGRVSRDRLLDDWGTSWRVPEYSFKPFPGCRCNHTVIDLAIQLHREGVRVTDVESVEIGLGNVNWITVGQPYDPSRKSVVHAQFNAAYGFARGLRDGRVGLDTYEPEAVADPAIVAITRVTRVVDDARIASAAIEPARVTLKLKDGRSMERASESMKGGAGNRMTGLELEDKLRACLAFGLGASSEAVDRLISVVNHLEESSDAAAAIVTAFRPGP